MNLLPKSKFVTHLTRSNKLDACDFNRFIFFQGMLFGSTKKWWGTKGFRGSSHEGLDLCFFVSSRNENYRLDETIAVPMLYDGRVEHVTDDFLGKTVITRHSFPDDNELSLLSLYGHLNPDNNLKIGDEVKAGEIFARISGFENRPKALLPHLHISLAKPHLLPPVNRLEWNFLNKADRSVFIDPLKVIATEYSIVEYDDNLDLSKMFSKCSRINTGA